MTSGPEQPDQPEQPHWPQYGQRPDPPYGQQPAGHNQPYGQQPGYGYGAPYAPVPVTPMHPQAGTALTLGIVGLAGTFVCGVLVVLGPFAWSIGAKVKREIAANPGRYRGAGEANAGMILGIITTVLLILGIIALVLVVVLVVVADSGTSP